MGVESTLRFQPIVAVSPDPAVSQRLVEELSRNSTVHDTDSEKRRPMFMVSPMPSPFGESVRAPSAPHNFGPAESCGTSASGVVHPEPLPVSAWT